MFISIYFWKSQQGLFDGSLYALEIAEMNQEYMHTYYLVSTNLSHIKKDL